MKKLKILFVTTVYPRHELDYAGIFIHRLAKALVELGNEVSVLALDYPGGKAHEILDGVNVVRLRYFFPRSLQALAYSDGIRNNIMKNPFLVFQVPAALVALAKGIVKHSKSHDLIHCHMIPTGFAALIVKSFTRKKIVLTPWGTDYRNLPRFFCKSVINSMDAVVTTATETTKYLEGINYSGFREIPAPIDEKRFNAEADPSEILREYGDKFKDKKLVTFVGRLTEFKDPITFVRTLPHVLEKRDDVVFVIVGDGSLMKQLEDEAKKIGVTNNIVFTGVRSDVEKILKLSSVFCALSPVENTWSNTIAEAMFLEVPLVLTDAGQTKEFFTDNADCLIVEPENPKSAADAILRILGADSLGGKLVSGADKLLEKSGKRTEKIVSKTMSLYEDLLS